MRRLLIDVPEDTDEVVHRKASDMGKLIQRNA
jgi:hypothetical protein